ncbi:hypothetical protein PF005_g3127 [Phytophthora fragariae]|uniref:Uncharacterized protein n=2 Tax=Phytophthora TaxID=4783 RepID=A0A6A3Z992_9STRA|nr:hypothetical protein PF003_g39149 [Phytophthora fragariae]KAE8991237.1 hypothetical protein PR001_g21283 [Phytophthora rubi]KAE8938919.1 hypothetical protein PF009_g11229 [Phytophthora fragariae]KAE9016524.1 hypothetical protein PR002_g13631 [Phytophthora rubi]KAE9017434.1 hypothetical protein PF011_g6696 [Phytophthora fragariae]
MLLSTFSVPHLATLSATAVSSYPASLLHLARKLPQIADRFSAVASYRGGVAKEAVASGAGEDRHLRNGSSAELPNACMRFCPKIP